LFTLDTFPIAFTVVTLLAIISFKFRIFDKTGAIASWIVGILVFMFGGWKWFILLFSFTAIASAFTKYEYSAKSRLGYAEPKGGARSWKNVVANGSIATILSILEGICALDLLVAGFLGAVGTAFADTLATEIGLLYKGNPRLITNLKKVPPGTSGAISPLGEAAMFLSIAALTILAYVLNVANLSLIELFALITISSVVGATIDSFLGATVQAKFICPICGKVVETTTHCNVKARHLSGIKLFNNHVVNLVSTFLGALTAILAYVALLA